MDETVLRMRPDHEWTRYIYFQFSMDGLVYFADGTPNICVPQTTVTITVAG